MEDFSLEWTNPGKPVYKERVWSIYRGGEGDELAWKSIETVGSSKKIIVLEEIPTTKLELPRIEESIETTIETSKLHEPGRFQVMALLQAVRYYLVYGDLDRAKSFGLNRAIFYAWAKYYGPSRKPLASLKTTRFYGRRLSRKEVVEWREVLGERVRVSRGGYYVMGGIEQRPDDFDRQVARRFIEAGIDFGEAWRAALDYVSKHPRTVLKNPQEFYKQVYEPVRDMFIERVLKKKRGRTAGLDKWFR